MKMPTNADELVNFMGWVWSKQTKYSSNARDIASEIGAKRLYHTVGGRESVWQLPNEERVIISNDGKNIRKRRRHALAAPGQPKPEQRLKNKGGHTAIFRKHLQYLVALLDADVPLHEIFLACDTVRRGINIYKQQALEKEHSQQFGGRISNRRKANLSNVYKYTADEHTPHEMKYLRECKRLGIEP